MRYGLWMLLFSVTVTQSAWGEPLAVGPWLVDLGRDYPRTRQAGLSDADAQITLAFMQAASRLEPELPEAYLWQYDMLEALNRRDAARDALANYVQRQPTDIAAYLNWIALEIEQLQTAEARAEFCRNQLARPELPSNVASDLHRRLAQFHLDRGDRDQAAAAAQAAIKAYELNFAARQLLERARLPLGSAPSEADELGEMLLALAANPNDAAFTRQVADRLLAFNRPESAERLYAHAVALLRLLDPAGELPQAMTDWAAVLQILGKQQESREQIQQADKQWRGLLERAEGTLNALRTAQMAWFYALYLPQPEQAEKLARLAIGQDPDLRIARLALGSALRQLGRLDEAAKELAPLAAENAAAAAEYARVLAAKNQTQLAAETLNKATTRPADPDSQLALGQAANELKLKLPATNPAPDLVVQAVQRFPWEVLDYPLHPDKNLSLELSLPGQDLAATEPWLLTARLTNVGTFPITLGPGMMVVPDLLVSVTARGDADRSTGPTLRFSLNRTPRLMPRESVAVTHTVDLGAIRSGMIGTPQMTHHVTITGVLAPLLFVDAQGQEIVAPGIGGLLAAPLRFRRTAFVPTDENMSEVMARLRSPEPVKRIAAMELLAMLLAEQQHIAAGRLNYSARPIDPAALQQAILGMASDKDWYVRARLAEALRWFSLDKAATRTAQTLLNDSHWLVRGLAMRTLADHFGAKPNLLAVLNQASRQDPEEWVRRLTAALKERVESVATHPAQ